MNCISVLEVHRLARIPGKYEAALIDKETDDFSFCKNKPTVSVRKDHYPPRRRLRIFHARKQCNEVSNLTLLESSLPHSRITRYLMNILRTSMKRMDTNLRELVAPMTWL